MARHRFMQRQRFHFPLRACLQLVGIGEPQNDVFVIFARLRRHHGERAGNILLNTFHLIHRHHQIVRNHTFDRNSVVVEFQAFDRRVEKILI